MSNEPDWTASAANPPPPPPPPPPVPPTHSPPPQLTQNQFPPAPPPGYQAPPTAAYHAAPPPRTTVDGLAIASMVLGILWIYWIGSVLAVVFAAVAIKRINASNGWRTGKGMAIAGLVLGIIGCATLVLTIIVAAASTSATR